MDWEIVDWGVVAGSDWMKAGRGVSCPSEGDESMIVIDKHFHC